MVARYYYDTWGKLIKIVDGSGNDITNNTTTVGYKNPFRYRGYYYDVETELYYLQSRYYDPEVCRLINADNTNVLMLSQSLENLPKPERQTAQVGLQVA